MKIRILSLLIGIFLIFFAFALTAYAIPGDADGNGQVDLDDAKAIARFVVNQIPSIPNPTDADANQDGKIDMEDAFIIAKKVTGQTRIVVVAPLNGSSDIFRQGTTIRIEVFEKFFPFNITGGTVRIRSASTGYDSGDQPLTFERDGRSLYYHWNTAGLSVASDYAITVSLSGPSALALNAVKSSNMLQAASQPDAVASLSNEIFKPRFLADVVDAFCLAPGMPLEFRRHVPNNAPAYPYLGPLGRGWFHSYDFKLEEFTDGRIALRSRIFQSNNDGTYQASPGDHGILVRNPDGTFQLTEKDGLVYRFRSNLYLDYIQDLNGNRITAIYDSSKHLIEVRHSAGKSFYFNYNAAGRIIKLTDHAGRITTYEYNSTNLMLTRVTDPAGNITEYTYNPGLFLISGPIIGPLYIPLLNFRLETTIFPDGARVQNEFDAQARLTRQTGAWGANPLVYSYDADGTTHVMDALGGTTSVKVNDRGQPTFVTTPDGAQISFQYDSSANLTQVTDPLSHVTRFSYDGFGNVTQVRNPLSQAVQLGYDLRFNKPSYITNPLGKTISFAYDSKGNIRTITYPDANSEEYDYDSTGNLISNTDAAGKMTVYSYNNQGQLTSLQNALGNTTQFYYDTAGDLQNVTDAKGHVVLHTRDTLGRLTRRTYPDGSHEDYEYDGAGKVTAFTNRRGEKISFSYDVTGRLEWKQYPSGKKLHFFYDATGYLVSIENVVGGTTTPDTAYWRDTSHRITKVIVPGKALPETYDVSYAYDAAGNRTQMIYPDGNLLNYAYDAANRLTQISDTSDNTIVAYEYDAAGRRTKKTLGNGTYTTYAYDDLYRLTTLINYSPGGAVQSRFAYSYDAVGIRTAMTTLEGTHTYSYDNIYQLTGVAYPGGRTVNYTFDKVGNRAKVTDNDVVTNYSSNKLDQYTQAGSETFDYDKNGNLKNRYLGANTTTYGWDEDDRLVSVDRNGVHIDYHYDYQGRLVSKTIDSQETRYIWDGLDLIAETDSAGNVVKRYVYGATIDEIIVVNASGTNYWAQQDGLGSVVCTTNDNGAIISTISYDVYGNVRSGDLGPVPQRFAGMWWDEDAGLYYVKERWYSSNLGKFISPDPFFYFSRLNRYTYSLNCPISIRDPLGLFDAYDVTLWITSQITNTYNKVAGKVVSGVFKIGGPSKILGGMAGGTIGATIGTSVGVGAGQWIGGITGTIITLGNPIGGIGGVIIGGYLGGIIGALAGSWYGGQFGSFVGQHFDSPYEGLLGVDDEVFGHPWYPSGSPPDNRSGWVWLASAKGWYYAGGVCPTFVQGIQAREEKAYKSNDSLMVRINAPWPASLLRSDIPIYGISSGKDFAHYRVEYGEGTNPSEWHLIEESDRPQEKAPDFKDISWMQGDLDLKGNLTTWNTGLKNWSHLPWHDPEDPTNLNGTYTLRLTVFGKNGEKAEDKINVEVGRVIAQCSPGIAISPDKHVVMSFPEQSLTHPFRIYTILPLKDVGEENPPLCKGCEIIGSVYRIREPGDHFIKDVSLEFNISDEELNKHKPGNIGIERYDTERNEWIKLETTYDKKSSFFKTKLSELPAPKAIYALINNPKEILSSLAPPPLNLPTPLKPIQPGVLIDNTFENDIGTFKQRDRIVGAALSRDNKATPDSSYCLKIINKNHGGNFSSTIIDKPFDVREYGTMTFDYRISQDVKVDFFLKDNGRWYNLRFTGDPVDYRNKDVNIANLGTIQGVITDDRWHTASVDLRYLLRQQTRHTRIDEIIMANWNVGGYMKLEFGNNPRGAKYYIDNFKLTGLGQVDDNSPVLLVDDFNEVKSKNMLGGSFGTYTNPGAHYVESSSIDIPPASKKYSSKETNRALLVSFDMTQPNSYGGYWTSIAGSDISDYSTLVLRLSSDEKMPNIIVGIRNKQGIEGKTYIRAYVFSPDANGWREVRIPLTGLRGLSDFSSPDVLFFSVSHGDGSGKGTIKIDDVRFEKMPFSQVADFEQPFAWTLFGGDYTTSENGAASLSASTMKDTEKEDTTVLRISYGGTIGRDYGLNGGFSYATWQAGLNGIDTRQFSNLVMRIRGEQGGEIPNIYLSDPVKRFPVRAKEMPAVTKEWQTIRIPLEHYAKQGIDLSHLESLEIVFEWEEQSGTVYVDDIQFE
ncbi:MAG: RHS repeat-associated core domain-containing protein [Nitrospirota bacterium]